MSLEPTRFPSRPWVIKALVPDEFDGCFLSGSPHSAYEAIEWIVREHELIQEMAAGNMSLLDVCFGSQILASALCGRAQVFRHPMYATITPALCVPSKSELPPPRTMRLWHA